MKMKTNHSLHFCPLHPAPGAARADQDDIRAGSDDEDGDVMTAVLAAVTRDRAVQHELSAARSARFASDGSSSEDEEGRRGAAVQRAGRAGRKGAAAAGRGGGGGPAANPFAPAGGGSSGDEEERPAGVVEFGGDYGDADDRPARKKLKKERQQREGGKGERSTGARAQPGAGTEGFVQPLERCSFGAWPWQSAPSSKGLAAQGAAPASLVMDEALQQKGRGLSGKAC